MSAIGTAVHSFADYDQLSTGVINSTAEIGNGGNFGLFPNAVHVRNAQEAEAYREHTTPGQRIYGTYIPYP